MLKFVLLLKCLPEEVVAALLRQSLKNGLDKGMENALWVTVLHWQYSTWDDLIGILHPQNLWISAFLPRLLYMWAPLVWVAMKNFYLQTDTHTQIGEQ